MQPVTQNRGMTARDLYRKTDTGVLQDVITEQIRTIDSAIMSAHSAGMNSTSHELPVSFNINHMPVSDAQTLVYSELLMIYSSPEPHGKDYPIVKIIMGPRSYIHIGWINGLDADEKAARKKIIQDRMTTPISRGKNL